MASPDTDAALIARVVVNDDRHAFAELVRRHQSTVRACLRKRTAGNLALADARKRKEELLGDADSELPDDEERDDPAQSVSDHSHDAALKMDLEKAMRVLSEGERAAIVQCYHNDLTHEEAAYVLGMPVGTVKTHVLRAKQKLKAQLGAWQR